MSLDLNNKKRWLVLAAAFCLVFLVVNVWPLIPFGNPRGGGVYSLTVKNGWSLNDISQQLQKNGIIRSATVFKFYATAGGFDSALKVGTFAIPHRISLLNLARLLSESSDQQVSVTIPEGLNLAQIGKVFEQNGIGKTTDFLKPSQLASEGYYFPDTYFFDANATSSSSLLLLNQTFKAKTAGLVGSDGHKLSSNDVVVASILEKEVISPQDMTLVADIIYRRLAKQIPLQIDSTVAYSVCLPKFKKGIFCDVSAVNLVDNLKRDSAYNTYTRVGLPPGPISNPGLAALQAALKPAANDYLYYLSTPVGKTIFSKTLDEHNAARAKYIK